MMKDWEQKKVASPNQPPPAALEEAKVSPILPTTLVPWRWVLPTGIVASCLRCGGGFGKPVFFKWVPTVHWETCQMLSQKTLFRQCLPTSTPPLLFPRPGSLCCLSSPTRNPGIKPQPPAVEAWTMREVPWSAFSRIMQPASRRPRI